MGKPTAKSSGKIVGRERTGGHNAKPMQKKKSKLVVTFDPEKRKCVACYRFVGGSDVGAVLLCIREADALLLHWAGST